MKLKKVVVLKIVFLFNIVNTVCWTTETGTLCNLTSTGQKPECISLSKCAPAIKNLTTRTSYPEICGFEGITPLVCCAINISNSITPQLETTLNQSIIQSSTPTIIVTPNEPFVINTTSSTLSVKDDVDRRVRKSRVPGEISKQKCREYSKHVFARRSPVLIVDVDRYMRNVCDFRVNSTKHRNAPARRFEFPHMAIIGATINGNIEWSCGGSIISEQYVISPAHCSSRRHGAAEYVRVGITNIDRDTRNAQQFKIIKHILHPAYTFTIYNDISLLKLEKPIEFTPYASPACLFTEHNIPLNKADATTWDQVSEMDYTIFKVTADFSNTEECRKMGSSRRMPNGFNDKIQLCVLTFAGDTNACAGSSGGPLQVYHSGDNIECMYDIVGLYTAGYLCGRQDSPGIYTRISPYVKWIEDIVWP